MSAAIEPITGLTLYRLDEGLLQLLSYREEREADQTEPITEDERAAIEGEIQKYMEALPKKVDGVAAIFRQWDSQEAALDVETDRIARIRAAIRANRERLKGYIAEILERQPQPAKGCKKLVGASGSQLMLKGNGGLAPLEIQEDVLPAEFRDVNLRLPLLMWRRLLKGCSISDLNELTTGDTREKIEPSNTRIREALGRGDGVPGAHLGERGKHVEIK